MTSSISEAHGTHDLAEITALFRAYENFLIDQLGLSLEFQGFERELSDLPGRYAPPDGRLFLAREDGRPAGCVAFYRFSGNTCEVKRLYVADEFRGRGIGKQLLRRAIETARGAGYGFLRLDSARALTSAAELYRTFDFHEIAPYNENPRDDVYYLELTLK